ncbi:hypothetical protein BCR33DRAFT_789683 [Rhizoclosmatium globosum]|uniref:Uncharacterized protein n=1 Tax=Rhizoclosmatium globosum TaxID=329046 RepID=A0A1Y2BTE6_9FUNG|nr:hypothetical protein BCR33DRAFT_789683 [Rhizoclosmatium globosum]|eukprot:ORY37405.1 hypothetical protein BCR33DRAFT_789683 [Rhizoclosmatium globosum]
MDQPPHESRDSTTPFPKESDTNLSYVSQRKTKIEKSLQSLETLTDMDFHMKSARSNSKRSSLSSNSLTKSRHPILVFLDRTKEAIMASYVFKATLLVLGDDRTKILLWYLVMVSMHVIVTTVYVTSIWVVMPGIWVYNFLQLFVIIACLIAHGSAGSLSRIVQISIASGDIVRGRMTLPQLADFWTSGKRAPAYRVMTITRYVETIAILILIGSSIFFSWIDIESKIATGLCQPSIYENQSLPAGIDINQFVQGGIDYAEVYNYGLPFGDGLVGGWAGWPMSNPTNSFQIKGDGPVYVVQVLCDNGAPNPNIDYGIYTHIDSLLLSEDERGFMLRMTITYPANSVFDDVYNIYQNSSIVQDCTMLLTVSHGQITFHFDADQWEMITNGQIVDIMSPQQEFYAKQPSSISQYTAEAHRGFVMYEDKFQVLTLLKDAVLKAFKNASYAPSQGATFCNMLSEGTMPDGFYHTDTTFRGVATAVGAAAHFALMQFSATVPPVHCDYYGIKGSGMLHIPSSAIYMSAAGSVIACLMKAFEILWWFMSQNGIELHAYRRARRVFRHPLRLAIDAAELMVSGMDAGDREEDICDITTTKAIEELGEPRIVFGEDLVTREMEKGHLRIGEYGKVKSILKEKEYGTYKPSKHSEWEEFTWH